MKKFFIEIGSADFNTLLCLDKNRWEGIIVEPVTELIENLADVDHIIYETSAITDKRGVEVKKFKYYDPEFTEGHWRRGISLILRDENIDDVMDRPGNSHWKHQIKYLDVSCITLNTLLEKHNVEKIDFLKIDTEGYEYSILQSYNWSILPEVMQIEVDHWWRFGITDDMIREFVLSLSEKGYFISGAAEIIGGQVHLSGKTSIDLYAVR